MCHLKSPVCGVAGATLLLGGDGCCAPWVQAVVQVQLS